MSGKVDIEKVKEAIDIAMSALLSREPLIYYTAVALPIIFDPEAETSYTDGYKIVLGCSMLVKDDRRGTGQGEMTNDVSVISRNAVKHIRHECGHILLKHPYRGVFLIKMYGHGIRELMNLVADAFVDYYTGWRERWTVELVSKYVPEYWKLSFEEVVRRLLERAKKEYMAGKLGKEGREKGHGNCVRTGEEKVSGEAIVIREGDRRLLERLREDPDKVIDELREKLGRFAGHGRGGGIAKAFVKKKGWKEQYRKMLSDVIERYAFIDVSRESRRVSGWYGKKYRGAELKVYIDVSGSISDKDYEDFISITASFLERAVIEVIFWDDGIVERRTVRSKKDLEKPVYNARGGTDFSTVLVKDKEYRRIRNFRGGIVILTDGYVNGEEESAKLLKKVPAEKMVLTVEKEFLSGIARNIKIV